MTTKEQLDNVLSVVVGEVELIRDFAVSAHAFLEPKINMDKSSFSKEEIKGLRTLGNRLYEFAGSVEKGIALEPFQMEFSSSSKVPELIFGLIGPLRQRSMLAEMTVVYLMAKFEDFTKTYLRTLLAAKSYLMKSKKPLTYEEVLSYPTMEDLAAGLAKRDTEELGRGSIDDLNQHFGNRFNLDLSACEAWETVREAHYRRNIIVHNAGRKNEIYLAQTLSKARSQMQTDMVYCVHTSRRLEPSNLPFQGIFKTLRKGLMVLI